MQIRLPKLLSDGQAGLKAAASGAAMVQHDTNHRRDLVRRAVWKIGARGYGSRVL